MDGLVVIEDLDLFRDVCLLLGLHLLQVELLLGGRRWLRVLDLYLVERSFQGLNRVQNAFRCLLNTLYLLLSGWLTRSALLLPLGVFLKHRA